MQNLHKWLATSLMVLLLISACFFIFSTSSLNSLINTGYVGTPITTSLPLAGEQNSTSVIVPVARNCSMSCPANLLAATKALETSNSAANLIVFEMLDGNHEQAEFPSGNIDAVRSVDSKEPGWEIINKHENARLDRASGEIIHDANIYLYDSRLGVLLVHRRPNPEDILNDLKLLNQGASHV